MSAGAGGYQRRVPDVVSWLVECVRTTAPVALAVAGGLGYLVVRVTRRIGFRSGTLPVRWPWPRRAQRIGRRMVIPAGHVPRRHRRSPAVGGIKQW